MDVEVEHPHAHHHTGHRKLDLVLPLAALFVSFLSILIAYHHGSIMKELVAQNERLVQANSLPYLNHSISTLSGTGAGRVTFRVANEGVGPAAIRSVELMLDGRPVANSTQFLERFDIARAQLSVTNLTNRMVRSGTSVDYFDLTADPTIATQVDRMIAAVQDKRLVVRMCFCSVFEECWLSRGSNSRPVRVEQCPIPKVSYQ